MDDCDRLSTAVDRKHALLDELRELGRRQLELIAAADLSSLLRVLAGKQRLVEQLQSLERELDQFRHEQPSERRWRRAEDRQRCAQALLRCESLIGEIIEQERQSEVELARQRDDAAGRLALLQAADEAHGAYDEPLDDSGQLDIVSDRHPPSAARRSMNPAPATARPAELGPEADLATVLAAWNDATSRLTQTHEALRGEVRRLTDELAAKNRELARRNRLADLGQMAAHVAHEVRNNLVPVTLYASLLRRRLADDSGSLDVLAHIESGLSALDGMAGDLLHFTCDRDPVRRTVAIRGLVTELLSSLAPQLAAQGIAAVVDVPANLLLSADAGMLRRALVNLTFNALDAMPDGGELTITACLTSRGVEIEVADTGPGLSDDARQRAFEPFFTTKSDGTGLGLAIVQRIAEAHGGDVRAANCPDGGAAFTLRLPRHYREAAA